MTLLLDTTVEIRYLAAPPSIGESLRALGQEWLVRDVVADAGHHVVACSAVDTVRRERRGQSLGSLVRGS